MTTKNLKANQSIIDRDIEFYQGEYEMCQIHIRICHPRYEYDWYMKQLAVSTILTSLKEYKKLLNNL